MSEEIRTKIDRRAVLGGLAGVGFLAGTQPRIGFAATSPIITKPIPKSGERVPIIGMGSWITFDVGDDQALRSQRVGVLKTFFEHGGGMIDSSPMYATSEEVIGYCLGRLTNNQKLFSATKVWTPFTGRGVQQMLDSERLWGEKPFDLFQIHNLVNWEAHLQTLRAWKAQGRVRYIGITTSHGRKHREMERIMASQPIDFIQLTYNLRDRAPEHRLLSLAQERGIAVIVNRPFQRGWLFNGIERKPLPNWAAEFGIETWAQYFLKFIVSHPAVTCAIPATSRVDHMVENMAVMRGVLPGAKDRGRMLKYVANL